MLITKKLMLSTFLLSPLVFSAPDEYQNDEDYSAGKTQLVVEKSGSLLTSAAKKSAEVIIHVTKSVYEAMRDAQKDHIVEIGKQGDKKFLRYSLDTQYGTDNEGSMNINVIPVKVTLEVSNEEDSISLREAKIAVVQVAFDFGISLNAMEYTKGESDSFSTVTHNRKHKQLNWFNFDYTDTLWSSENDSHKLILNGYYDWKLHEEVVDELIRKSYTHYGGFETGLSLGYQYDTGRFGKVMPEVGYRKSYGDGNNDEENEEKRNGSYSVERSFIQVVFKKDLFEKECKLTVGYAKDQFAGEMSRQGRDSEVYAKGKCKF